MNVGHFLALTGALSGGLPALPRSRARTPRPDLGERERAETKRASRARMRERIDCAAVRLSTGEVLSLPRPARHHQVLRSGSRAWEDDHEQGFTTTAGRFVGREEALRIARRQGQIVHRCGGDHIRLFSENLW